MVSLLLGTIVMLLLVINNYYFLTTEHTDQPLARQGRLKEHKELIGFNLE